MKYLITFVFLLSNGIFINTYAQDCNSLLETAYKNIHNLQKPKNDQLVAYSYQVTMNRNNKVLTDYVSLIAGENFTKMSTNEFEMYDNNKESISILKNSKLIHIVNSPAKDQNSKNKSPFDMLIQLQLLRDGKIIECEKSESSTKLTVSLTGDLSKRTSVDQIVFEIDEKTKMFTHINFQFVSGFDLSDYQISNMEFNENYVVTSPANLSLLSTILNANGEIQPKYKDYKIIDRR